MPDFLNHNEIARSSNQQLREMSSQTEKADAVTRAFRSAPDKGVDKRERRATIGGEATLLLGAYSNYLTAPLEWALTGTVGEVVDERAFITGFVDANKDPFSL